MTKSVLLATLALIAASSWAAAAPLDWRFEATGFEINGLGPITGTLSGSFTYDADTNAYSNIDVTAAGFAFAFLDGTFNSIYSGHPDNPEFDPTASSLTLIRGAVSDFEAVENLFFLSFAAPLTNAGGTFGMGTGAEIYDCTGGSGTTCIFQYAGGSSAGFYTTAPVPTPAALSLLVTGALALGAVGLRRRRGANV